MDDRLIQRLEEQLRDAHSTNSDLRERLGDVEGRERAADAKVAEANVRLQQLERAHARQKAAEEDAAAAQRTGAGAEREALRARGEMEELREQLDRAQLGSRGAEGTKREDRERQVRRGSVLGLRKTKPPQERARLRGSSDKRRAQSEEDRGALRRVWRNADDGFNEAKIAVWS
jgi:chromosome segregation ATPase